MQREKLKLLSTIPLALILVYLLVNARVPGSQQPQPGTPSSATTMPASRALPGALPPSAATPTVPTLATTVAAVPGSQALPRDPFAFRPFDEAQRPPPPRHPQQSTGEAPSSSADEPPLQPAAAEKLRLKATLIDRYGKVAFINGQVLREGHTMDGYTIVSIAPGHVVMAQGRKVIHLRLANGGAP